jgi:uncharacterized SAM-binding protein YcdF (DUF218 family)
MLNPPYNVGMKTIKRVLVPLLRKRIWWWLFIITVLWVVFACGLTTIIHFYGQNNQVRQADVIIVLGSGLRRDGSAGDALYRRSRWAAQVWQNGYAPYIICTGGVSEEQSRSEASACQELLVDYDVPADVIYLEETSRSTEENAANARAIMEQHDWREAIIVTDSFHAFRAHWIFNSAQVTNYPSPVPTNWVRVTWYVRFMTREIIALHWQAIKEIFNLPYTYVSIG